MRSARHVARMETRSIEFWSGNLRERDHLKDLVVDGRIFKMELQEVGWEGTNCTDLAQDTDRWRAFVNALMNTWVP